MMAERYLNHMRFSGLWVILWFLAVLFLAFPAKASDDDGQVVRVGYYENEVFQEGAKEGAVKTGYAYEYYCKLSEYTGWDYEYVYGGFDEMYEKLLNGEVDLLAGLAKRDDRTGVIAYPDLPMGNEVYTLVKHDTDEKITADPEAIAGSRIGVLKSAISTVLDEYLDTRSVETEVVEFGDYESLFEAFDENEVDILAAEGDGAYGRGHTEVVCTFGTSDYYLCVNIRREDLLRELNAAQSELEAEEPNYLSSLRSKYYSSSVSSHTFSSVEKEWLLEHDSLIIGYLENYLPYCATDENGVVTGIVKDIVPEMMEEMDIRDLRIEYIPYGNYDEMIAGVQGGNIDVAFPVGGGLYYSEESGIYQSNAVASATTDLVYRGDYTEDTTNHFAVNENNRMQDYYVRTYFPDAEITLYPSIDDCLSAVLSGKASATTLNGLRANDILRNSKYNGLYLTQLTKKDDRSFGVKIGNEGLLRLLNRGINVLGTEYAQNIAYRYAGNLYKYTFGDMVRDHMLPFAVLALIVFTLFAWFVIRDLRRQRRASRLKSDFVSSMSHEIRTPITAILGMNELIRRESSDAEILRYSDNIEKAGESLLGIINDILDFSKIEAGRMELNEHPYYLADLLSGLCVMISYKAEEKGLAFEVEVDGRLPRKPLGDEQKIRQIITNLLSNAVKYTEEGRVSLRVSLISLDDAGMTMEVAVEDTGIGIREEDMGRLYSAFERVDLEKTGSIEGSGLGLAITQRMLELMGSSVSVKSVYGKGSVFSFVLSQGVQDPEPIGENAVVDTKNTGTVRTTRSASFTAPGARILIVDDTPMNLQVISGLLKRNLMMIDTAESGERCIELFGEHRYDLVLLDQRMPAMDGVETLHELLGRFPDACAKTPIICLTANVLSGAREEMLKAGFADYLTKPVDLNALENVLIKHLPAEKVKPADMSSVALTEDTEIVPEDIRALKELDVRKGLEYCGDLEDYLDALRIYAESVETKASQLEKMMADAEYEAFSMLSHSIKSTSGAIGAEELRGQASDLEKAAGERDGDELSRKAPEFLRVYRALGEKLNGLESLKAVDESGEKE